MSIRWRASGELLCGAKSEPMEGDCYIDDRLHYRLSVELGVIIPDDNEAETGRWHWTNIPATVAEQRRKDAEIARNYDGHKKRYERGFDSGAEAWSEDITRIEIAEAIEQQQD